MRSVLKFFLLYFVSEITFALNTRVLFLDDGVKITAEDELSTNGFYFEVQLSEDISLEKYVDYQVNGNWEFFEPGIKIAPGQPVKYRVTAYRDDGTEQSEWISETRPYERPARSMKRAVVFRDDYNSFNKANYKIDCTAWGGGNGEFQFYTPEAANIYTRDGKLFLRPTLTVDHKDFDSNRLYHGRLNLNDMYGYCTMGSNYGCDRSAVNGNILNPIMSGKVTTHAVITYGTVTVRAMIPKGDWLWPAIWMLPRDYHYGGWPRSGEIDMMESRGNVKAVSGSGNDHGVGEVSSTLHWGPDSGHNAYAKTHGERDAHSGDWHGWHTYKLEWTADHIRTTVDGHEIMNIHTPSQGFWSWGGFHGHNIWSHGGKNAPFDQPFHLILNVAVGGGFFPSSYHYDHHRPWSSSGHKMREFWEGRNQWLPTWHGEEVAMQIDYVELVQA